MTDQHESPRNSMTTPSHDDVARRAYELFEARGGEPGHDLEHWLDAERQLTSWRKTAGNMRLRADRRAATADEQPEREPEAPQSGSVDDDAPDTDRERTEQNVRKTE